MALGAGSRDFLTTAPFNEWYDKNYQDYKPDPAILKKIAQNKDDFEIAIFLGTWCGDSKRGVPPFLKVMDEVKFNSNKLRIVSVDNTTENYKQSPRHEEKGLNIFRVPTYLFYKNGIEVGRIIERPITNIETDIAQIMMGVPSTPSYIVVPRLHQELKFNGDTVFDARSEAWANYVSYYTKNASEVNSYGYVLLGQKRYQEAIAVFKINAAAYPENANTWDSLAEAYLFAGDKSLAELNYKKVLDLDPENKNAIVQLEKLRCN
jgi:tetratricopeptide (TPR) repeat protein